MKKQFGEYYLAFDIGTDSVGWAVTDLKYNLERFHGKNMWGVRLFEEGKTAAERRLFRASRRRLQRRKQRINLLQEIFAEEISKVDMGFFHRLKESKYRPEDKNNQTNTLFNDARFKDKDYHAQFPTIFHLRKALIESSSKVDVRLVYLALEHILKNRGHFLFEGQQIDNITSFETAFLPLNEYLREEYDEGNGSECSFSEENLDKVQEVLKNTSMGVKDKSKKIYEILGAESKQQKEMVNLICGGTATIKTVLNLEEDTDLEVKKLCFKNMVYEDVRGKILDGLGDADQMTCLDMLKTVFDWSVLADIKKGYDYLSSAKVGVYNKHNSDIKTLKCLIKKYYDKSIYNEIFNDVNINNNYVAYVGMTKKNHKKQVVLNKKCTQEDFCKFVKGYLEKIKSADTEVEQLKLECANLNFAPKQINRDNGVIPYQMHLMELEKILDNAKKYLPFLTEKDSSGYTGAEKIVKIMTFRIPYYVGPLNDYHKVENGAKGNCWIVKNSNEKIRPWNFEQVVNQEACAEAFITRMTNKCTYLRDADVLPQDSLLYSKFVVLNELNNVRVNGDKLPVKVKQHLYRELFMKQKKVTKVAVYDKMVLMGEIENSKQKPSVEDKNAFISGIDGEFKGSLGSFMDFEKIIGKKISDTVMVEEIIKWIVLFGDTKKLLEDRVIKFYGDKLTEQEIKKIVNLKYSGWGRLSKEFLEQITSPMSEFENELSIIEGLYQTQNNLMELLSGQYQYLDKLQNHNNGINTSAQGVSYETVADLYVSPAVRRSIWQTLVLAEEIKGIMGHEPKKIFIEMTRSDSDNKKRSVSRRNSLIDLYKKCKDETRDWVTELEDCTDGDLRGDKLFFYYTQMGKCMYTGERIDLHDLFSMGADGKALYDIEHIFPQSKIKDDSLDNRVLVKASANRYKGDKYPVPEEYRHNQKNNWEMLWKLGFISRKKYDRLVRNTPFSEDELAGFIARQIVETSQATKAVAEILQQEYTNSEIVYVKAGDVSRFRQENDFVKCRDINDYHHAKDAYLNIIVGNVYNTKFTHNPIKFIQGKENKYSLNKMYDFKVERDGIVAWEPGEDGTIVTVNKTMSNNRVLFTRYASTAKGGFFKQMILKKGKGQAPIKGNLNDPISNIANYGGYNEVYGAYFFLVEHTVKGKRIRTIEHMPILQISKLGDKALGLVNYCLEIGLVEPKILLAEIKINTLFKVNGFKMHISGRSKDLLLYKCAEQLFLPPKEEKYFQKISKYVQRIKDAKGKFILTDFDKNDFKKIDEDLKLTSVKLDERLVELYDQLLHKLKDEVYSIVLSAQINNLEKGRELFMSLSIEEQIITLSEILHLFACKSISSNLSSIGGAGRAGILTLGKNISKLEQISIINQSPTGLFEQEIDLLKL